jgi:Zn-dependent peptidase ImmA (M78 family)
MEKRTAQECANYILNTIWDKQYPVNVAFIIEELDISLEIKKLESDNGLTIDGALYIYPNKRPLIQINHTPNSIERMRFTAAHEIGHYMYLFHNRPDELSTQVELVDYRGALSNPS